MTFRLSAHVADNPGSTTAKNPIDSARHPVSDKESSLHSSTEVDFAFLSRNMAITDRGAKTFGG